MIRCVGPHQTPTPFPSFAMAALAAIRDLPDTIEDRAVVVRMRRRHPDEHVDPYRIRRDGERLHRLRERLAEAMADAQGRIEFAEPDLPVEDREADCWEPLVAVADVAGGEWPGRARHACEAICAATSDEENLDVKLLADLPRRVGRRRRLRPGVGDAGRAAPARWRSPRGVGSTWTPPGWPVGSGRSRSVRRRVRPEGHDGSQVRGYKREDLEGPWARYLPTPSEDPHPHPPSPRVTASPDTQNRRSEAPSDGDARFRGDALPSPRQRPSPWDRPLTRTSRRW